VLINANPRAKRPSTEELAVESLGEVL